MRSLTRAFAAALAGVALLGSAAAQEEISVPQSETYVHVASGMMFPPQVGEFRRISVYRYAADGSDESAGYNLYQRGAHIAATVYVYPAPGTVVAKTPQPENAPLAKDQLCAGEFDRVQLQIERAYEGETLIEEGRTAHGETLACAPPTRSRRPSSPAGATSR